MTHPRPPFGCWHRTHDSQHAPPNPGGFPTTPGTARDGTHRSCSRISAGAGRRPPRAAGVAPRGKVAPRRMYRARGGPARPGARRRAAGGATRGGKRERGSAAGCGGVHPTRDIRTTHRRSVLNLSYFDESPKTLSRAEVVGVQGTAPGGARRAGEIRTHAAAQRSDPYRALGAHRHKGEQCVSMVQRPEPSRPSAS